MTEEIYRNRIREAIKTRGMTQTDLAERTGFTQSKLSRILDGHSKLSMDDSIVLSGALGISLSALVGDDDVFYSELGLGSDHPNALKRSRELFAVIGKDKEFAEESLHNLRDHLCGISTGPYAWQETTKNVHPLVICNYVIDFLDVHWDEKSRNQTLDWSRVGLMQELGEHLGSIESSFRELQNLARQSTGKVLEEIEQALPQALFLTDQYRHLMEQARSCIGQALLRSGLIDLEAYRTHWKINHFALVEDFMDVFSNAKLGMDEYLVGLGYDCVASDRNIIIRLPEDNLILGEGEIKVESLWENEFLSHWGTERDMEWEECEEQGEAIRKANIQLAKNNKKLLKEKLAQLGFKNIREYKKSEHWKTVAESYTSRYGDKHGQLECLSCDESIFNIAGRLNELHLVSYQYLGQEQKHLDLLVPICNFCHGKMLKALDEGTDLRITEPGIQLTRMIMEGQLAPEALFSYFGNSATTDTPANKQMQAQAKKLRDDIQSLCDDNASIVAQIESGICTEAPRIDQNIEQIKKLQSELEDLPVELTKKQSVKLQELLAAQKEYRVRARRLITTPISQSWDWEQ